MTTSKLRNSALPLGLAALAAVLIGMYIVSYRNSVTHGAGLVKVLVASRDIPSGTEGSQIAAGGYLKTQTVPRRAVVPGSVTSAAPLTSLVAAGTIYKGQQITLRQFAPVSQGGVFAKFSGNERVVIVPGTENQLMAGTLSVGDHVDVVATARYHTGGISRSTSRVVLHNLLVLDAPEKSKSSGLSSDTPSAAATIVMTDSQAQTMGWAMKNTTWFLALRPTKRPRNSQQTAETLFSFLARGLSQGTAPRVIAGDFPESVDDGN